MIMRGFTLLETLVVIAMLATVGIALSGAIQYFYQKNAFLLEQTVALDSARKGILDTVHSIRQASYGSDGAYPISSVGTSTITFYSDLDNDGIVERVRYYLSDKTLYRGVAEASGSPPSYSGQTETRNTVAAYVSNGETTPLFTFFDANGIQLSTTSTNIAQIASVSIRLDVDLNPNRAPNIFTLIESATLRNLRTN